MKCKANKERRLATLKCTKESTVPLGEQNEKQELFDNLINQNKKKQQRIEMSRPHRVANPENTQTQSIKLGSESKTARVGQQINV